MSVSVDEDSPGDREAEPMSDVRIKTPKAEPHLDRAIQAQIGDRLRAMYGELIDQPVPDKLSSILDRLGRDSAD